MKLAFIGTGKIIGDALFAAEKPLRKRGSLWVGKTTAF